MKLVEDLELAGTPSCGTIMMNRRGLPPSAKACKLKNKGETFQMQKGNMLISIWKDKRQISTLSTNVSPGTSQVGGAEKPRAVVAYNATFSGFLSTCVLSMPFYSGKNPDMPLPQRRAMTTCSSELIWLSSYELVSVSSP